jgi:KamA family protein
MTAYTALRRGPHPTRDRGFDTPRFEVFTERDLDRIPALARLSPEQRFDMRVVASVLPFRVNGYVIDQLIDWERVPDDPVFRLTFPQRGMLAPEDFRRMARLHAAGAAKSTIQDLARQLRAGLNPHPGGQLRLNVPSDPNGQRLDGIQHKYRETVLFFPGPGQTCHSYCTFCFRWAQFIGDKRLRMGSTRPDLLLEYLRVHPEVSDLLLTGGDPMVMNTRRLASYLAPLLHPDLAHVRSIRIGTKALTFWPQRFVTDRDADTLIRLLERLVRGGKHVAIMAHYNHWRELDSAIAQRAVACLRNTGAEIRSQGPLLAGINDDPVVWARLWEDQVRLGVIPYYLFVERDTGARRYFEVPLARAWQIYRQAVTRVSGLGRTARGPSMSAGPGKVEVQGVAELRGERVFVLRFIQARDPDWVQRPFFAAYDERASWLDQLKPAFGEEKFFFEDGYREICRAH